MNTELLAMNIIKTGFLKGEVYSLKEIFQIRDALYVLDKFNLADLDLLKQVEKYLDQEREHRICSL